jgi:hypothetical protein
LGTVESEPSEPSELDELLNTRPPSRDNTLSLEPANPIELPSRRTAEPANCAERITLVG